MPPRVTNGSAHPPGGPEGQLYTRLGHADSIRLLSIKAVNPDATGILECSLQVVRLSDAPSYKALSYAWKEPTANSKSDKRLPTIYCNGVSFSVLSNLHHALFQLREIHGLGQHFWIDFLCINQEDLTEKSTLTSIMSQIYRSAEQVIVWLGPSSPHISQAVDLLKTLAALSLEEQTAYAGGKPLSTVQPSMQPLDPSLVIREAVLNSETHWIALASFFRRSWFSRCWVAQEVLLAKTILVLCGSLQLTWPQMYKVSHYLIKNAQNIELMRETFFGPGPRVVKTSGVDEDEDAHIPQYDMPTRLAASRDPLAHPDTERPSPQDEINPLLKHLIRSRRLKCLDPRDTIYSLLGVVPVSKIALPTPNYLLDPATVYHHTALSILQSSNDLLLLAHAEGKSFRKLGDLPSWVPDWSVRKGLGLGITGYKRFDACAGRERVAALMNNDRVLAVEAAIFDKVIMVGESKRDVLKTGRCEGWINIAKELKEKLGWDDGKLLDEIWRSLITDTAWSGEKAGKDHPANNALEECFLRWMQEKMAGDGDGTLMHVGNWVDILNEAHFGEEAAIKGQAATTEKRLSAAAARYDTVYRFALQLKLFLTAGGRLGLGTESVGEGDSIAIVSGSRVPLILRPLANKTAEKDFELVGATYVHGCMHGEICKREGTDASENFPIRQAREDGCRVPGNVAT